MEFFFVKQRTAYEMRISDWSSDVCSSDLEDQILRHPRLLLRDLVQRHDLAHVHDGGSEAALDRVVEEDRVQHVARGGVETEGDVGEAEQDLAVGQLARDGLDGIQSPQAAVAVILVAGADRQSGEKGMSGSGRVDHGGW